MRVFAAFMQSCDCNASCVCVLICTTQSKSPRPGQLPINVHAYAAGSECPAGHSEPAQCVQLDVSAMRAISCILFQAVAAAKPVHRDEAQNLTCTPRVIAVAAAGKLLGKRLMAPRVDMPASARLAAQASPASDLYQPACSLSLIHL